MIFSFVACTPTSQTPQNPGVELDERANTTLGNGNYVMHNYMSHTYGSPDATASTADRVDLYLQRAEVYNKGMIDDFAASLKGRPDAQAYFNQFINNQKGIQYEQNISNGFDPMINKINNYCKPIFVDMIETLDNHIDRINLLSYIGLYYCKEYKYAFGNNFGKQSSHFNPKEDYEFNKKVIFNRLKNNNDYYGLDEPFDVQNDFESKDCRQITEDLDRLFGKIAQKKGGNFTAADFRNCTMFAVNGVAGGDAMHDYYGDALENHAIGSCSPVERQETFIDVMLDKANELFYAEQEQQNGMTM